MERFIANAYLYQNLCSTDLKSSMERFIECDSSTILSSALYLKSSMERFIVGGFFYLLIYDKFKIQYGEIYRNEEEFAKEHPILFKIQYGEIYSQRTNCCSFDYYI